MNEIVNIGWLLMLVGRNISVRDLQATLIARDDRNLVTGTCFGNLSILKLSIYPYNKRYSAMTCLSKTLNSYCFILVFRNKFSNNLICIIFVERRPILIGIVVSSNSGNSLTWTPWAPQPILPVLPPHYTHATHHARSCKASWVNKMALGDPVVVDAHYDN